MAKRFILVAVIALCASLSLHAAAASPCEFVQVKAEIDRVLEKDKELSTRFRKEVDDGADSLEVLSELVNPSLRPAIDACRFETSEYLAKRGFPPAH